MIVLRGGRHIPKREWAIWRDDAMAQVLEQGPHRRIENPCQAVFLYFPGDLRTRDIPGMMDAVFHVMERAGLVSNDGLIVHADWLTAAVDRKAPRLTVNLREVGDLGG